MKKHLIYLFLAVLWPCLRSRCRCGFSLIEMSVAVSVAATIAVGFITWAQPPAKTNAIKAIETRKKMSEIEDAIEAFRTEKTRLPCPSDPYMRSDNQRPSGAPSDTHSNKFGIEDLDLDQTDGSTGVNCPIAVGSVPVRSLGLEYEYTFDAWGRKFSYHVSPKVCGSQGCAQNDYQTVTGTTGVTVKLRAPNDSSAISSLPDATTDASYVLISHGANGLGSYLPSGEQFTSAAGGSDQEENHDGDSTYVSANFSSTFDDLLIFRTKNQIENLAVDKVTKIVDPAFCNTNSTYLSQVNATTFADMNTNISAINTNTTGSDMVLSILWTLQNTCGYYYGDVALEYNNVTGWDGPKCPGGGIFKHDGTLNISWCMCPNGQWDGNCND